MTATQLTMEDALEASGDWAGQAMLAVEAIARTGRQFTAYDLVECYGLPEPTSVAAWGALFRRAKNAGLIRRVGYEQSRRPETKGSAVAVWAGAL
jgi:hypothetical protein